MHASERDYTFTLCVHGTRTRFNYYTITPNILRYIREAKIIPWRVSDHNMVKLQLEMNITIPQHGNCRMNTSKNTDPADKKRLIDQTQRFLKENQDSVHSSAIL